MARHGKKLFKKLYPAMTGPTMPSTIEWRISEHPVPYPEALQVMEERVAAIHDGRAPEMVWLLEHPPLYTAGTSAKPADLLWPDQFPVYDTGRGGQYTYHGPGQRVAYVMLDLGQRGRDLRRFVCGLEDWVIATLAAFNIKGERRPGRVGVWVDRRADGKPGYEDKIAAIGVRVRHWVTFHGISINVEPDLSHYAGIVPCGLSEENGIKLGVTSLVDLGHPVTMTDVDNELRSAFERIFSGNQTVVACSTSVPSTLSVAASVTT